MVYRLLAILAVSLFSLLMLQGTAAADSQPTPMAADNNAIPFENLAQNLPEAFSALEGQFQDPSFKSMLTSQLNNPHAVEMFQSLIHDPSAASSISALLDDPRVQSSLSVQFVEQYISPESSANVRTGIEAEATNDLSSQMGKDDIEHLMKSAVHSSDNSGTSRPRALVAGILLTVILGAIAPV
ncbi:hypothetical protein IW145_004460 [Coemansia sp. RSA 521]|nr:hypothetical protein LPJ58_000466 [Coemansia sp. RSA 1591]KAJ1768034.1 hypothetical protein LPJ69_000243 [Coemansia sp. RSA 1752]KAJ1794853.1 hypothetical protein LPJ67_000446 [Coemansia sp. RSA 1938]KAJ2132023.1 hypothetical protein GGH17_003384 [Coemansia sp. RSA 788]KAJ2146998.1 hypothetical protein IW142_001826 [Coemansia sp. RSA 564]KAJ2202806.1 hypothetical protein IW145_004460 [Coemansia sp. RSA 521]KAJ2283755.1 hypothetical protein GGH14_000630 [Coemansia sp. RSA 370]KAJ2292183.1 